MLSRKYLLSALTNHRLISTSCCLHKNNAIGKQVHMLKKIMAGREKGKRRFIYNENLPKAESVKKLSDSRGQPKESNRRVTVLNKLFMKNITDLMATDSFSKSISGYGIQISVVKVSPDFQSVNVFWLAQADENDLVIEETLKCIAGPLRHELSQLRLMGEVPRIFFLKDKYYSRAAEVDILLNKADFGDDFQPTDPTLFMKSRPELHMTLPDDIKKRILEMESMPTEEELEDEELPEMRHDVLGIDHSKIMKRIATNIISTKRAWENFESKGEASTPSEFSPDFTAARSRNEKLQRDADLREKFVLFLKTKQIEGNKKHKAIALKDDEDWEDEESVDLREDDEDFEDYYNSQWFDRDDEHK